MNLRSDDNKKAEKHSNTIIYVQMLLQRFVIV